jgi:regulator of RNase E activity RraA
MGRSKPVIVTMSKVRAEDLFDVMARSGDTRLTNLLLREIEGQAGRTVTLELVRKDALELQRRALNDIRMGGKVLNARTHSQIEKAFMDAWWARFGG